MHKSLLSVAAVALTSSFMLAIGCGGYKPPTLGACALGTPLDEGDCAQSKLVAADRCFSTKEEACDCLQCPKDRCTANDRSPAQVSCGAE